MFRAWQVCYHRNEEEGPVGYDCNPHPSNNQHLMLHSTHIYLNPKSMQNHSPKPPKNSPKGHYFVYFWGPGNANPTKKGRSELL